MIIFNFIRISFLQFACSLDKDLNFVEFYALRYFTTLFYLIQIVINGTFQIAMDSVELKWECGDLAI